MLACRLSFLTCVLPDHILAGRELHFRYNPVAPIPLFGQVGTKGPRLVSPQFSLFCSYRLRTRPLGKLWSGVPTGVFQGRALFFGSCMEAAKFRSVLCLSGRGSFSSNKLHLGVLQYHGCGWWVLPLDMCNGRHVILLIMHVITYLCDVVAGITWKSSSG